VNDNGMRITNGFKAFAAMAAFFLLISWLRLEPVSSGRSSGSGASDEVVASDDEAVDGVSSAPDGSDPQRAKAGGPRARGGRTTAGAGTAGGTTGPAARAGLECKAGSNGGSTDTGVSGNRIRLATTAVLDGQAKTLLEDSVVAMKAVLDKVNKAGGVCGRILDLRVVNDSFRDDVGLKTIKNFIAEGYFALPVVPSAEGLGAAILSGEIRKAGIPVVGSDGMRQEQYGDPWVWPVASATVTAMRVMAKYGATKYGAKTFAIVWDRKYKFGKEGADAFKQQVAALGGTVVADRDLDPDQVSYASEVEQFKADCGSTGAQCDMVAMLLLPDTAKKWLQKRPAFGRVYTAGAQTLFTDRFAQDCVLLVADQCHGFAVWTGYNPPVGPLASLPGVAQYVSDLRAVKPDIDVNNQFVEGAYLGMSVFVEALKAVGPDLTRARLQQALDAMDHTTDLASQLSWRPDKHAANVRSQSFSMTVSQGTFRGWANEGTGFLLDPAHGG
jgi:ABC-type branched-subunit amino acid transport system substrate-binding protein